MLCAVAWLQLTLPLQEECWLSFAAELQWTLGSHHGLQENTAQLYLQTLGGKAVIF